MATIGKALVERNVPVPMRDGTMLYADVYRPEGGDIEGPYPVLLLRTAYNKEDAQTMNYAHPSWYARHGYIVVVQDVRGRWASEGEFDPYVHEAEDGYDTIQWASGLPGAVPKVGMYGFSYCGAVQWQAAWSRPPALACIAPGMIGSDAYQGKAYRNGAFSLASQQSWAFFVAQDTALRRGRRDWAAELSGLYAGIHAQYSKLPLSEQPGPLNELAPYIGELLEHPLRDEYWLPLSLKERYGEIEVPALNIGGWYDLFIDGTIENYVGVRQHGATREAREGQYLYIEPWYHMPWSRYVGELDFGPEAANVIDTLQLQWFDRWLKGNIQAVEVSGASDAAEASEVTDAFSTLDRSNASDALLAVHAVAVPNVSIAANTREKPDTLNVAIASNASQLSDTSAALKSPDGSHTFNATNTPNVSTAPNLFNEPHVSSAPNTPNVFAAPIQYFVMGSNTWRQAEAWPIPGAQLTDYYLHSTLRANSVNGDGLLDTELPGEEHPDVYVYHPSIPVPALGGRSGAVPELTPMGPKNQLPVEVRNDVLVYTSQPLAEALTVAGEVTATLFVSSSAEDTDVVAKLVDVYPDGRAINIAEGILRVSYRHGLERREPIVPGEVMKLEISLGPTAITFLPGHAIRLDVTSSLFPTYDRNPNRLLNPGEVTAADFVTATQTLFHESQYPSSLRLPVIKE